MKEAEQSDFPPTVTEFARGLAKLCAAHNLSEFTGKYRPGFKANCWGEISFAWDSGRHGADSRTIRIRMEKTMTLDIHGEPEVGR